jgi:ribose-phosphate pyrophosphokinase
VASVGGIERADAMLDRFPNGELHARLAGPVRGRACMVVGSITPPDARLAQLTLLAHALRRAGARSVTAVLPYLAYARQDRAEPAEALGLAWVGGLLGASGVDDVVTVDVHSQAASDVMGLPVTSISPAELLAAVLPPDWTSDESTFVAPDEGAIERCRALAAAASSARPIAYLTKRRSAAGVAHMRLVGDVSRRAVIVDDILDTGATLLSCCGILTQRGVEQVGVVVTHGVLTGTVWRRLWSVGMRRLWITDTIPSGRARAAGAEIVPVAPLLVPVLQGAPGTHQVWAESEARAW